MLSLMLAVIRKTLKRWMPELPSELNLSHQKPADARAPDQTNHTWRQWSAGLLGYGLFGVGYIGYMTFVVALLREQGATSFEITFFYAMLGLAVVLSSRLWAGLLNHYRGGQALALLNALLSVATVIPAITSALPMMMLSGLMFGGVFLSIVASTTAMVKHNLPPTSWASGISAFTVVFAIGQIVGPTVVGWIADGPGGLQRGLFFSAAALLLGALIAWQQKPLQEARVSLAS
jgi:predicted MFS family arabinose efflux permease